jgi:CHAD domain-containing protein
MLAELELWLHPADAPRLLRAPALAGLRSGRARTLTAPVVWHDTAESALAREGLALSEARTAWRLERMSPDGLTCWPPGTPPPLLAEASSAIGLGHALPASLMPVVAFEGRQKLLQLRDGAAEASLVLLEGALRAVTSEQACSRVLLSGPAELVGPLSRRLAEEVRLSVPSQSLAAEGLSLARGPLPSPHLSAFPSVPRGITVAEAFVRIAAHLSGVILRWSRTATSGEGSEPVHQMRVAVRRLRSAITVFRRPAGGPVLDEANAALQDLAARLGAARDWDVFLEDTTSPVRDAFAEDHRIERLLETAARKRDAAYRELAAYLDGPDFRRLGLELSHLAALRGWEAAAEPEQAETLAQEIGTYAARMLDRRLDRMLRVDPDLSDLPLEALHELRKDGKRLRYACEFFAGLFPGKATRRFLRRLAALQEELGRLNDGATAAGLLDRLGGGADRAFAAGVVQGFVAARGGLARKATQEAWRRFIGEDRFWE